MIKLRITVKLKEGIEDPEALAVKRNLILLGFKDIENVSISKNYEILIKDTDNPEKIANEMCDRLLVNPVIHEYRVEVERV